MAFNFLQNLVRDEATYDLDVDDGDFFSGIAENEDESDIDEELIQDLGDESSDTDLTSEDELSVNGDNLSHPTPQPRPRFDREWSTQLGTIDIERFSEETGPANNIDPGQDFSAFDYLSLFLPETFFEYCAEQTNAYANIKFSEKPDPSLKLVSADDIKVFLYTLYQLYVWNSPVTLLQDVLVY